MELDLDERKITIPDELTGLLRQDRTLRRWYDELNHSTRNDVAKWVSEPKSAASRIRRAEQIAERLLSVMEAERALPPILQLAFARDTAARQGWDSMSVARRRGHLMAIFYYRTPEAQARRVEKMLEDARRVAEHAKDRDT
jgi:uncharacterized protein YdeI (YjbR/CyaY-like superfamily)